MGTFGRWSLARSFTAVTTLKRRPRELAICAAHPLFILYSGDEIAENWQSLPAALRPYMVLRVERHATEDLLPLCELAQQHQVPILIQVVGPHDVYSGPLDGSFLRLEGEVAVNRTFFFFSSCPFSPLSKRTAHAPSNGA